MLTASKGAAMCELLHVGVIVVYLPYKEPFDRRSDVKGLGDRPLVVKEGC